MTSDKKVDYTIGDLESVAVALCDLPHSLRQ